MAGGAMVAGVLLGTCALGYGVTRLSHPVGHTAAGQRDAAVIATVVTTPAPPATSGPAATSGPTPSPAPTPTTTLTPRPAVARPGPPLLRAGDHGPRVRELQSRLRQLAWYAGDVDDSFGRTTTLAVRGFQAKRAIPVTGAVDRRTMVRLVAMTHPPTTEELANRFPGDVHTRARLDARCLTGRVLCIDKTSSTLRWVVDGKVEETLSVRFGAAYTPTREGLFHVQRKAAAWVSTLYGSAMPYAMFFSGGQAVHYSSDFAARGYSGASHGCVNVRDLAGIRRLFDAVRVGDTVVVYWS